MKSEINSKTTEIEVKPASKVEVLEEIKGTSGHEEAEPIDPEVAKRIEADIAYF